MQATISDRTTSYRMAELPRQVILAALCLLLCLAAMPTGAQSALQSVGGNITGTVENLAQDDGRVVISGRSFGFDDGSTEVYLQGERVNAADLNEGMVVRFTVDSQGTLLRVDILGPFNQTRLLEQH